MSSWCQLQHYPTLQPCSLLLDPRSHHSRLPRRPPTEVTQLLTIPWTDTFTNLVLCFCVHRSTYGLILTLSARLRKYTSIRQIRQFALTGSTTVNPSWQSLLRRIPSLGSWPALSLAVQHNNRGSRPHRNPTVSSGRRR